MRAATATAERQGAATRRPGRARAAGLTRNSIGAAALLAAALAHAADAPAPAHAMRPLQDAELAAVHGADGIAFNLSNFSLFSNPDNPLTLTYQAPDGSALTLSGLDLSRTDDADPFADPYQLSLRARPGLPDVIALDFPLNAAGSQKWALTTDFSHCSLLAAGVCTGSNFLGGTLQVTDLTMKGGGLYVSPSLLADTEGIALGLGTQLDIGSLAIYPRGRAADGSIDTGDQLLVAGIHLADANTGGAWMLADIDRHPGLLNAATDASGSYLHLQVGWPTTSDPVPAAALRIDNITFTTAGANGAAPAVSNLGSASIASMRVNYVDIKFRAGP